jgi:hypothetical protein
MKVWAENNPHNNMDYEIKRRRWSSFFLYFRHFFMSDKTRAK